MQNPFLIFISNRKLFEGLWLFSTENRKKKCVVHELVAYKGISRWYKKIGIKESGLKHMIGNIEEIMKRIG